MRLFNLFLLWITLWWICWYVFLCWIWTTFHLPIQDNLLPDMEKCADTATISAETFEDWGNFQNVENN